jgi:DNA-binding MarR family transcriptional regulator
MHNMHIHNAPDADATSAPDADATSTPDAVTDEGKRIKNLIFVHSILDEAGLNVYQFRVLAHVARRGQCFASLETTAKICQMSIRKAQYTLKELEQMGLVVKQIRKGRTDIYHLAPDISEKIQQLRELNLNSLAFEQNIPF